MLRYLLATGIIIAFILTSFSGCIEEQKVTSILYVDTTGGQQFTHIQDAIDAAGNNTTIFVYEGLYEENLKISMKSLVLTGENKEKTIIEGTFPHNVLLVEDEGQVTVSNFTFRHKADSVYGESDKAVIHLESSNNSIVQNIIQHGKTGVYLQYAQYNNISKNFIQNHSQYGVFIYSDSRYNILYRNLFKNNSYATRISKSTYCRVINNTYQENKRGLYLCCGATVNTIYHNSFINNSIWNVKDSIGGNTWYKPYPIGGNYWDEYNGTDAYSGPGQDQIGSDGIGDERYTIPNVGVYDQYPFMEPYS